VKNLSRVTIVGVGALGSHVAQLLRNDAATIKVIDFDRVEQKNILAQFHGKPSVGKNKAESLKQSMQFFWGIKIQAIPHRLSIDNVDSLLGDTDLVIDCLDNSEGRRVIQAWCRKGTWLPCIHGALSADGQFGRVIWTEMFNIDDEDVQGQPTCEGGEHLPFIGIVSSYVARAAQEFLRNGRRIGFQIHPGGVTRV
jgi:molybdopterin/thiamine biosynthesis adenylyltransferase